MGVSGVWFTSDLHIGHRLVSGLRGFETTDEHDAQIADRWSAAIRPTDQVWVLGDLAVSSPKGALALLAKLPGVKHLIAGNHDPIHSMHRESHKHFAAYMEVFASVQTFARRKVAGSYVMLSHFPYGHDARHLQADGGVDKYAPYRLRDEGLWLLHGHTHTAARVDGREIHVGVDAWNLSPVPLDVITSIVEVG